MSTPVVLFWFRRDLRLHDNAGLFAALSGGLPVQPIFIFDTEILDELEEKQDKRVQFIHQALQAIQEVLVESGATLDVRYGKPLPILQQVCREYSVKAVYTNEDYEPYARTRDEQVANWLQEQGIAFHAYKDQVIFAKGEVLKDDGTPYTVFTPYSRKWRATLMQQPIRSFASEKKLNAFHAQSPRAIPSLSSMGFISSESHFPSTQWNKKTIKQYKEQRDLPGVEGTSRLGVHLRFGTISVRQLAKETAPLSESFVNELIWRDFYHMIIWHFPRVVDRSFKPDYDGISWRNNEKEYEAWFSGQTGYPIVDAGMRELNTTGYMHNRVRMIVASFLTKHLLIDWRWGEAYFAQKLLDFDLAANNGGWQWAAGSGCDAAPYFRVFNPYLQTQKFDPDLVYIRKWVPEFEEFSYPKPIVIHEEARKRCLETYAAALKK
ncbi:MAG: cryptochrome/photolyase family protein [Bacteroidota bacterium]